MRMQIKPDSLTIYTDGGSRGNPGPGACAMVAIKNDQIIHEESWYLGVCTNNIAEYNGVVLALQWFKKAENSKSRLTFFLDSELVVKQLNGVYKVKDQNIKILFLEVVNFINKNQLDVVFLHIPREKNKHADLLVNRELDSQSL